MPITQFNSRDIAIEFGSTDVIRMAAPLFNHEALVPPLPPPLHANSMRREHQRRFNQEAFGINETPSDEVYKAKGSKSIKSFNMSEDQLHHIVEIVSNWDKGSREQQMRYRKIHSDGYNYVKKFEVRRNQLPDGTEKVRLHRKEKDMRMVIHELDVFDAIHDAHQSVGHMKRDSTWVRVKQQYHNISQVLVRIYIALCPVCIGINPVVPQLKGAKKPILSDALIFFNDVD